MVEILQKSDKGHFFIFIPSSFIDDDVKDLFLVRYPGPGRWKSFTSFGVVGVNILLGKGVLVLILTQCHCTYAHRASKLNCLGKTQPMFLSIQGKHLGTVKTHCWHLTSRHPSMSTKK